MRIQTFHGSLQRDLDLVRYHQWEQFCTPTGNVVVPTVQEFFASLKNDMIKRGTSRKVIVRGKEIPILLEDIYEYYNVP